LFKSPYQSWGLDLIAANLWRGRDHGIAGYNFYLEACGSKRTSSFDDLLAFMRPQVSPFDLLFNYFRLLVKTIIF